jgi:PAS domain S-box-containing protein
MTAPTNLPVGFDSPEHFLSAIIDSSDDAIITKDLNGIVTSWNKAAERIFGYTADEMIGQPILRLIPPDRKGEEPAILGTTA